MDEFHDNTRYSHTYPYGTAEAYKTGSYGHFTSEGPAKIVYTQDISGIEGYPVYQQGTPLVAGVEKYIVAPIHTSAHISSGGSWHKADSQQEAVTGDLSGVSFAQEEAGIGAQDFESAALAGAGYERTKGAAFPKVPTGSFVESGAVGKSGSRGSSTTGGDSTRDFSKATGHSDSTAGKISSHTYDKISHQRTVAIAPNVPTGSFGGSGYEGKSGSHRTGNTAGHSQVSFTRDFSKVTGKFHQPEIQRPTQVSGGIASQHTSGPSFGTTHKTGTQGISQIEEVSFIEDREPISEYPGNRVGQRPAVTSFDKLTTGGVSFVKQSPEYDHRSGSVYKSGTHGFSTVPRPQVSFILGGTELYQQGGYRPTYINKLSVPAARPHSSGYVHRTGYVQKSGTHGFLAGAGPQISFTRGQTVQRQPNLKPVAAIVPKQSAGYQRHFETVSGNKAHGFPTASRPSGISFIQDFSKVTSHPAVAIKPEVSTFDEFGVPAYPGTISSQGYQSGQTNKAFLSSRGSSAAVKSPKKPVVPQTTFTEFDRQSPAYASFYESAEDHTAGDKSIFIEGPTAGFDDKYGGDSFGGTEDIATSYNVSPEDQTSDKNKLDVDVPAENDNDQEKPSTSSHSSGVAPANTHGEERD